MQTIPECSAAGENGVINLGGQEIVHDLTKTCSMLTNQVSVRNTAKILEINLLF